MDHHTTLVREIESLKCELALRDKEIEFLKSQSTASDALYREVNYNRRHTHVLRDPADQQISGTKFPNGYAIVKGVASQMRVFRSMIDILFDCLYEEVVPESKYLYKLVPRVTSDLFHLATTRVDSILNSIVEKIETEFCIAEPLKDVAARLFYLRVMHGDKYEEVMNLVRSITLDELHISLPDSHLMNLNKVILQLQAQNEFGRSDGFSLLSIFRFFAETHLQGSLSDPRCEFGLAPGEKVDTGKNRHYNRVGRSTSISPPVVVLPAFFYCTDQGLREEEPKVPGVMYVFHETSSPVSFGPCGFPQTVEEAVAVPPPSLSRQTSNTSDHGNNYNNHQNSTSYTTSDNKNNNSSGPFANNDANINNIQEQNHNNYHEQYSYANIAGAYENGNAMAVDSMGIQQLVNTAEYTGLYIGLPNIGNTCYLNALLQCLFRSSSFAKLMLSIDYHCWHEKAPVAASIAHLWRMLAQSQNKSLLETQLQYLLTLLHQKNPQQFIQYNMYDANPALRSLLATLHEEFTAIRPALSTLPLPPTNNNQQQQVQIQSATSAIMQQLYFQRRSVTRCSQCNKETSIFDWQQVLLLEPPVERMLRLPVVLQPLMGAPLRYLELEMPFQATIEQTKELLLQQLHSLSPSEFSGLTSYSFDVVFSSLGEAPQRADTNARFLQLLCTTNATSLATPEEMRAQVSDVLGKRNVLVATQVSHAYASDDKTFLLLDLSFATMRSHPTTVHIVENSLPVRQLVLRKKLDKDNNYVDLVMSTLYKRFNVPLPKAYVYDYEPKLYLQYLNQQFGFITQMTNRGFIRLSNDLFLSKLDTTIFSRVWNMKSHQSNLVAQVLRYTAPREPLLRYPPFDLQTVFDQQAQRLITQSNARTCRSCQNSTVHSVRYEVWQPGQLLFLCLARYETRSDGSHHKIKAHCSVPPKLIVPDLASGISRSYDLCGVCEHRGDGAGAGHYVAVVRQPDNQPWCRFDDSYVTELHSLKECKTDEVYIFVYELHQE